MPQMLIFADRFGLPHGGLRNALATGVFDCRVESDLGRGVLVRSQGRPPAS
jgi:hypothetical protein